jgi:large subunit ribosomal protein L22
VTGPKLNEANRVAGAPGGVKAQLRWVRMSASKFRPVLNQVRGLDVVSAREVLSLHSVEAARIVQKLLKSAVANALHNNSLDEETLYVKACFADESPTSVSAPEPRVAQTFVCAVAHTSPSWWMHSLRPSKRPAR